jgi:hypothetical protein
MDMRGGAPAGSVPPDAQLVLPRFGPTAPSSLRSRATIVVLFRALTSLLLVFAMLFAPSELWAKPATRVDVTEVVLGRKHPNHEAREKEVGREVRRAAQRTSKSLDFGGMKRSRSASRSSSSTSR